MKLVELRKKLKARKPVFTRSDAHKKKRISRSSWRRPKGIQNKMRLNRRGYNRTPSSGYGSPKGAWGLSPEGLMQRVVASVEDFKELDPKTDGIIVARTLGNRKRVVIVDHALKNNFTILNLDVDAFKAKVEQSLKSKTNRKKDLEAKKVAKAKEEKATKEKEAKEDASKKAEDKESQDKEKEKKEYDKLLAKGDQ